MALDSGTSQNRRVEKSGSVKPSRSKGGVKIIPLSEEGFCIAEIYLNMFKRKNMQVRRCVMKTLTGPSEREVYKIHIWDKKPVPVFCDTVTGTLFNWQGKCLSSDQRRIVRWL